jgi:endonuclease/exonuclease/phosphatase family metal-dependent hydrolase
MTPTPPFRLSLATYNIHHAEGMDKRLDIPRVAGVLKESGADVACLQEVDDRVIRSGRKRQLAELGLALGMETAFGATLHWPMRARYGNGILSGLPVSDTTEHLLPGAAEQRGLLETRLDTPAGPVAVFCTHLGLPADDRGVQVARIIEIISQCGVPALLAGDFNEDPDGPNHAALLAAGLVNLGPETFTFPSTGPSRRIDYVYGTPHWRAVGGRVIPSLASDHCALVVQLELHAASPAPAASSAH